MQSVIKRRCAYLLLGASLVGVTGCSTFTLGPGEAGQAAVIDAPMTTADGQLLAALGGAASGAEIQLPDGARAVAGDIYAAASGRSCRPARLHYADGRVVDRLACEISGRWQWVPAVTLQQSG
jgi:hypothetical protein